MPNGECPVGAENRANIRNLQGEVSELDDRVRNVEKCVTQMKATVGAWAAIGAVVGGVIASGIMKIIIDYIATGG